VISVTGRFSCGTSDRPLEFVIARFRSAPTQKDTTFAIVMWLDAHYRDEDDPPIIDFDKLGKKAARLAVYCSQNPTHALTTAAEPIMEGK
jgi:hypothetical protein